MTAPSSTELALLAQNAGLRLRLEEAEETLHAIRSGEVDALVVATDVGEQVFTLQGLDAESNRLRGEMLAQVGDAVIAVDDDQRVTFINAAATSLYGVTMSQALGGPLAEIFTTLWPNPADEVSAAAALEQTGHWRGESRHVKGSGEIIDVESSVIFLRAENGTPPGHLAVIRDITSRKRAELALRESEQRFRSYFDMPLIGVCVTSPTTGWLEVNDQLCSILGYCRAELLRTTWTELTHPDDLPTGLAHFNSMLQGEIDQYRLEKRFFRKNGEVIVVDLSVGCVRKPDRTVNFFVALLLDITTRKRAETALQLALGQKTSLVKEIHHRVKNNLAIMVSLINMQARRMNHPDVLAALADTKSRLLSMSLLHEMLYRSGRMDRVEVKGYLEHLCAHLSKSCGMAAKGLVIESRAPAALPLELDQAVPCGLVVCELVTNALKHAFPDGRPGKVLVELEQAAPDEILLRVSDNGIGLPDTLKINKVSSLGLTLVNALTQQLEGTLEVRSEHGTLVEIRFPLQPAILS
jgi:PAS domain S-box-containing protein